LEFKIICVKKLKIFLKKQLFFNRTNIYIYKAKTKMKNFETIKKIHCPTGGTTVDWQSIEIGKKTNQHKTND